MKNYCSNDIFSFWAIPNYFLMTCTFLVVVWLWPYCNITWGRRNERETFTHYSIKWIVTQQAYEYKYLYNLWAFGISTNFVILVGFLNAIFLWHNPSWHISYTSYLWHILLHPLHCMTYDIIGSYTWYINICKIQYLGLINLLRT